MPFTAYQSNTTATPSTSTDNDNGFTAYSPGTTLPSTSTAFSSKNPAVKSAAGQVDQIKQSSTKTTGKLKTAFNNIKTFFGGSNQGVGAKLGNDVSEGAKDIQTGTDEGGVKGLATATKGIIKAGARTAGDVAGAVFEPINEAFNASGIGDLFSKIGTDIANSKAGQKLTDLPSVQDFATKHPNASEDLNRVLNIAAGAGEKTSIEPEKTATDVKAGVQAGAKQAADFAKSVPGKIQETAGDIKEGVKNKYITAEKNAWEKPTTKTAPAYNKATDIFNAAKSKGTDIPQVLLDNGIKLSDNVETQSTGRQVYNTADTAEKVRSDAQKVTTDILRPALKEADLSQPPVPSKDFVDTAVKNVENNKSITTEAKDKIISAIKSIKFKPTYSLEGLLDEKITRDLNSKYSPVGDIATNQEAIKNKAIGDAIRNTLKSNVPKDIPIDDVNKEASKLYQTADYLDSLHTKPVPKSLASTIRQTTAKVIGAAIGDSAGGLLGGVGGYHIAGVLERAFENMSDPIKTKVLNSLKTENPAVFDSLKKYIGNEETARLTRKALPAGDSSKQAIPLKHYESPDVNKVRIVQGKNVIPDRLRLSGPKSITLGGETKDGYLVDASGNKIAKPTEAQIVQAKKHGVTMNPKTGRFQKSYMSSNP